MKILVIHNFHRKGSASGDDQVFKNETKLLEENGNEVVRYAIHNDEFDDANIIKKCACVFGMFWSFKHYRKVKEIIETEKPDVVHVHTFFPLLSPSILVAAKKAKVRKKNKKKVKVVATLHDTRFVCPCATSLNNLKLCNKCGDGNYFRMVKYGCFKKSRLQSLIVAFIFKYHRIRKTFYNNIDRYICLNDNQIKLLERIGFDKKKIVKKYNFVDDVKDLAKDDVATSSSNDIKLPDRYAVFYGRIGEEKGIGILKKIWEKIEDIPLVVMGGGPLEEDFRKWAKKRKNVIFLGYTQHERCLSIVKKSQFVVFPSIWYEGCSMVEIETESLGVPLVATDLGFSAEAIEDGVNGYKVKLNDIDGYVKKIRYMWDNEELCHQMGKNARDDYEKKYMPDDNYRQLIDIYERTING